MNKKAKLNIALSALIVICAIVAIMLDAELVYYGESSWGSYGLLPMNLHTKTYLNRDGEMVFAITDARDGAVVDDGVVYFKYPDIMISEILKYGVAVDRLLVLLRAKNNKMYYFEFSEKEDPKYEEDMYINVRTKDVIEFSKYKWIDIKEDEEYATSIKRFQRIAVLIALSSIIILIFKNIEPKRRRKVINHKQSQ